MFRFLRHIEPSLDIDKNRRDINKNDKKLENID